MSSSTSEQPIPLDPAGPAAPHPALLLDGDAERALDHLAQLVAEVLRARCALVALWHQGDLSLASCAGRQPPAAAWAEGLAHLPPARRVAEDRAPVAAGGRGGAFLGVPLESARGRLLGVLGVIDAEGRAWGEDDARLLRGLAASVVAELDRRSEMAARRRVEEALQRNEVLFRQMVESANDVIYRADRLGFFIYTNPAAVRVTGYPEAELIGTHFRELVHPDYRQHLTDVYSNQIAQGTQTSYLEFPLLSREGREVWLGQHVQLLWDGREVVGVQAVARDITAQRQVERALRESEERFRHVVETLGQGLLITDLEDVIQYANSRMEELTGYPPEELVGRLAYQMLLPPEQHAQLWEEMGKRRRGDGSTYELSLIRKDGSVTWQEIHAVPYRDPDGEIVGTLALLEDVGERRRAQQALRESEERFRQLAENIREVFWMSDLDKGEMLYVSPAFESVWGRSRESVSRNRSWFLETIHPEDRERVRDALPLQRTGEYDVVYRIVRPDGEVVWIRDRAFPFAAEEGETLRVAGLAADITEQRRAEEALRESEERYRLMVEGGEHVFFYVHDEEHRFEYLSPSVQSVLGYAPEELIGRPYDALLTGNPSDAEVHETTHERMASGEGFSTYVALTRHKDGRTVPIELVETPMMRDGRVAGMQGFARDITERHRAREALERSEQYFRSLTENALDLIHVINPDGTTRYVSPSVTRLLGYTPEDVVGRPAAALIHPDDVLDIVEELRAIRNTGESHAREIRVLHRDGSWRIFEGIMRNLHDDPVVAGVVVNSRDITERRRAEEALRESEEVFRTLVELSSDAIFLENERGQILDCNPTACRMFGYDKDELVGLTTADLVPEEFAATLPEVIEEDTGGVPLERVNRRRDGSLFPTEVATRLYEVNGERRLIAYIRDITERKQAGEENRRLAALSRTNPNPVLECDAGGRPVHINPAAAQISRELGVDGVEELLPTNHEQLVRASLEDGQGFRNVEAPVGDRIFSWTYQPIPGNATVYLFAVDITSRRHMEEQLRHDALHDALTGLPNRLLFLERLAHAILRAKRRPQYQFAVLFLDLDRFKVINDSLGHHVGDELLIHIATRLRECLRPADTVARLGGDEFAILLEEIQGVEDATRIAERIQSALSAPVNLSGLDVFTSASVGIALSSSAYERPEYLLRNADMAMYRAKATGQARFEVFDRAMHAQALTRLQLETDLRRALEREEFQLHYQPIISLETGRLRSVEALVRWAHPDRGWMAPDEFIPVAEETGIILAIGDWVMREACRQAKRWQDQFPHDGELLAVGVNLSAKQLSQADLVEKVGRTLEEARLSPCSLRLEITESAAMENAESAVVLLSRLKGLGVGISLDDFGTGYSSLSYLHRFPLDALKIDRSFVGRMDEDDRSAKMVHTIVTLASSLGVSVVAEGVETEAQREALRQMQCEYGQGYLFARPLPPTQIGELLRQQVSW